VILENGSIRTLEPSMPTARALAIAGRLIAGGIGTHEQALASPEVVDLRGRCVLPGFNDAHVHFPSWSLAQQQVRLEGTQSLDEALQRVAAAARDVRPGRWLRGLGWRSGDWSPSVEPTKEALDRVTGDTPTALMARDYHSLWLNSAALDRADGELEQHGGVVVRDERGEPTGVLREECAWHFRDTYIHPTEREMVEASREGIKLANARGVTAVHDKDGWLGALAVFQRLQSEGSLSLRVWESHPKDDLGALLALPLAGPFGNDFLRLGYVKAFMDGTLGSRTARMLDGTGVEITTRAELEETIVRAAERGFPVAVHAIGDLANRDALDAFEATRDVWHPRKLRPRVEHAQLLGPEDIGRFAQLGVACSVQFSHAPSDRDLADRFWADKTDGAYAYRSLWDSGAVVANGSDAPIEELDPWAGVCAGVLRTIDDRPPWHPEQRLTLEEALVATCVKPAWLAGDERRRGKLVPGFLADLVVLDRDPFAAAPEELPSIEIVATMVGGRWVHNPPPWDS
jgi:predicted amidohydrolase YtcJ